MNKEFALLFIMTSWTFMYENSALLARTEGQS
jgi:hypothetical protein